jgi:hypothetical protein
VVSTVVATWSASDSTRRRIERQLDLEDARYHDET